METYEAPKMEVIQFESDDVIVTSCIGANCSTGGGSSTVDANV
jgi:hypothetical protein